MRNDIKMCIIICDYDGCHYGCDYGCHYGCDYGHYGCDYGCHYGCDLWQTIIGGDDVIYVRYQHSVIEW